MKNTSIWIFLFATTLFSAGCTRTPASEMTLLKPALEAMTAEGLLDDIRVLSSDEFEGRGPGTKGEELTVRYLTDRFRSLGLKPGNPDGTYLQKVPMMGFRIAPRAYFTVAGRKLELHFPEDYVAVSRRLQTEVKIANSDLVFVGYGVVAPEYGWDDYKKVDVKGKTLLMLINDPQVPDPDDPSKLDDRMFKGKAMTYYGRWTYKYEIAFQKGAAAAILIHETGPAGYPYAVVAGSWGRENFDIYTPESGPRHLAVESWITLETARKLFMSAGTDFDVLKRSAMRKGFKPVELRATVTFDVKNTVREIRSNNVIARLDGSDAKLKNQNIIYSAHWDHLGKDESLRGDQIYHGALDNASGAAALIQLAKSFTRLREAPRRSILFLSTTGEEEGLLGAEYYAANPLYPLKRTAAFINIDGINPWGRTRDVVAIGLGNSTLDETLRAAAKDQDRIVNPDTEPEKGFLYRSDQFEFARHGVPFLYTDSGSEFIGRAAEYGQSKREDYTARDYHRVTDVVKPDWDLAGAMEDLQLLFRVGYRVAQDDAMPQWKPNAEFKPDRVEHSEGMGMK